MKIQTFTLLAATVVILAGCKFKTDSAATNPVFEAAIEHVRILSADDMQGREVGTAGSAKAEAYLRTERDKTDVFDSVGEAEFSVKTRDNTPLTGTNIFGLIEGQTPGTGPLLVITAHYDHIGVQQGKIYNGADDNASGTAAMFVIADSFKNTRPRHDILFVWLDAEERGLQGAVHHLARMKNYDGRPTLNMNMDMISQNQKDTIFMSGSHHTPTLKPLLERAADGTGVTVNFGNDRPEDGPNDWTLQSDHGVFHKAGFPFVYFGVEDHPHYHQHTDEFETLPLDFYRKSLALMVNAARTLDDNLDALAKPATQ